MSERRKFTDYEKKTVYARYNGCCAICGKHVKYNKMTVDHKNPLSNGGTNEMNNLQLACMECNFMKNKLTTKEFHKKIRKLFLFNLKNAFLKGGAIL